MPDNTLDEDQELAEGARHLARSALLEGFKILENGRPQDKIALIKQLVTPMMRTLGTEDGSSSSIDKMREEFESLMGEVRAKPVLATTEAVEHRNQELRDDPPRPELGATGVLGGFGTPGERRVADSVVDLEGEAVGD